MAKAAIQRSDRIGLVRPSVDAHSLGISALSQILEDCGILSIIADAAICEAAADIDNGDNGETFRLWIRRNGVTVLGFSYRLSPEDGVVFFRKLYRFLENAALLSNRSGPIRAVYFAGLPETCELVRMEVPRIDGVFVGDETPGETLAILGVDARSIPSYVAEGAAYDESRLKFGKELILRGEYRNIGPVGQRAYPEFGTTDDSLIQRISHGIRNKLPPLMRAHVGPYMPDRKLAVETFLHWTRELARTGLLDILSIGTSQLSQSDFYGNWAGKSDGGGVPIKTEKEFSDVWKAARPMLVRTYAGTKDIPRMAKMYERTIHAAWHTLSLWWFCRIDGRGPYSVLENLRAHLETISFVAQAGKPFEPNVPHHFAFRGADDVSYIVSGYLAAKTARLRGIRHLVLQVMLNTPKYTWGIQDLAKARTLLALVRELEGSDFSVILQPRGGLDYFSHDLAKAKAQLAAVTALMDDIEPEVASSPEIIHVVSYSEAAFLADPPVVDESIRITRQALMDYRKMREQGAIEHMGRNADLDRRVDELTREARAVIRTIEQVIPNPYSPEGLYDVLASGFLALPYLWECRDEFRAATQWNTRLIGGGVKIVDSQGIPIAIEERMETIKNELRRADGRGLYEQKG